MAFYLGRVLVFRASNTSKLYAAGVLMTALQAFCYTAVSRMAGVNSRPKNIL